MFLKIPKFTQENTCVGVFFLIKLQALDLNFKNTFFLQNTSAIISTKETFHIIRDI